MFLELYSIKDKKMQFNAPMVVSNLIELTRSLTTMLKRGDSTLAQFPEDYALYLVAKFDQAEGRFVIIPSGPQFVAEITSFITQTSNQKGLTKNV